MKISNFDFHCNLDPVILWQYLDAERLKGIVSDQQAFMDDNVEKFFDDFNKDVLNIETANTFGLGVWGALLQVPRPVYTVDGHQVTFTDTQYRLLLRARIYLLTFDGSAKALNEFFHILFPDLAVTIKDNGDMTADISVLNEVDPEIAILFQHPYVETFLPRPSGVGYNMTTGGTDWSEVLGFEGQTDPDGNPLGNFDSGVFISG